MKRFFLLLLCATTAFVGTAQESLQDLLALYNTRSIPYISVTELRVAQLNETVTILDAREMEEYEVSRIPSALYVGYTKFSSEEVMNSVPNKETPIVVYCSLGIRSEEIGEKLKKAGFTNVKNLYGGIFEWKNKEYPILNKDDQETEDVHTCTKSWGKWLKKGNKIYN
ncbi:MAG: rhodanese-like domain-containing protein [Bacteroidota bacterium]